MKPAATRAPIDIEAAQASLRDMLQFDKLEAAAALTNYPIAKVKAGVALAQAMGEMQRASIADRWSHHAGTPETLEQIHSIPPRQRQGTLLRMFQQGTIDGEQLLAAHEIAQAAETITLGTGFGHLCMERIDGGGGGGQLREMLGMIQLEATYTAWRKTLPSPHLMIIDMLVHDRPFIAAARIYGLNWRTARKRMVQALDWWVDLRDMAIDRIDGDYVARVYARIEDADPLQL